MKNPRYRKEIEVTDTGMIVARVFHKDGRRVGLKFFTPWGLRTTKAIKKHGLKAHAWADAYMLMCETIEICLT